MSTAVAHARRVGICRAVLATRDDLQQVSTVFESAAEGAAATTLVPRELQ